MSEKAALTIIVGYRNRELTRIKHCLDSLERQTCQEFRLIFVDYGSDLPISKDAQNLIMEYPFGDYIYSDSRGYPWNRSAALNIGIRRADSEYILTTDIDMVFARNFVEVVLKNANKQNVLHCATHWLPRKFNAWENIDSYSRKFALAEQTALGGCQCLSTKIAKELRGFDEVYKYWGVEDRDLNNRLKLRGIEPKWLNNLTAMFHQWHPKSNARTANYLPLNLWGKMNAYERLHQDMLVRNSEDWGRIFEEKDRPIFNYLDFENLQLDKRVKIVDLAPYQQHLLSKIIEELWNMQPNDVIGIDHAFFPSNNQVFSFVQEAINKVLWKVNANTSIHFGLNLIHSYLFEFIETYPEFVLDYYLGFPINSGVSFLIRS